MSQVLFTVPHPQKNEGIPIMGRYKLTIRWKRKVTVAVWIRDPKTISLNLHSRAINLYIYRPSNQ